MGLQAFFLNCQTFANLTTMMMKGRISIVYIFNFLPKTSLIFPIWIPSISIHALYFVFFSLSSLVLQGGKWSKKKAFTKWLTVVPKSPLRAPLFSTFGHNIFFSNPATLQHSKVERNSPANNIHIVKNYQKCLIWMFEFRYFPAILSCLVTLFDRKQCYKMRLFLSFSNTLTFYLTKNQR